MRVVAVPCLKDNYAYLVIEGEEAAVVDPGEAAPVEAALAKAGVALVAIWLTHHHHDHVGGVAALVAAHPGVRVVAGAIDAAKIQGVTEPLSDGATTALGGSAARAIHNPGHTSGAISFVIGNAVFTGDTLFGGGCGRLFEGDAKTMQRSLETLAELPGSTLVYFGHEYTVANLKFAQAVEPANLDVIQRAGGLAAVSTPSTMAVERATNPFLRTTEKSVIAAAKAHGATGSDPASVFAALRTWKDTF